MFFLLTICVTVLIYIYFSYKYNYWKQRNVETLPVNFPYGNIRDILLIRRHYSEVFTEIYNKIKGPYAGIYFGVSPVLFVKDPDLIKDILVKNFDHFQDRGVYFDEKKEPLSAHLFRIEGSKWKNLRIKLTPAFSSGKLKMMFNTLLDVGKNLESVLKDVKSGEDVDFSILCQKYTTDVIASIGFGFDANSLKDKNSIFYHFTTDFKHLNFLKRITQSCLLFVPEIMNVLKLRQQSKESEIFFMNTIRDTVKYREENNVFRNDFMQLLIQIKSFGNLNQSNISHTYEAKTENVGLTMNELSAQAYLYYIAGLETSNLTLSNTLYYLALHMDIQEKLQKEIDSSLIKTNNVFTYDSVAEMEYLNMVILESMRLRPALTILNRICNKAYNIPNTNIIIEKGTKILISVKDLQNDPKYFKNPDKFDPERFSSKQKQNIIPYTYMPFGEGPRNCIGLRQGKLQTKIGLLMILKDYRIEPSSQTKIPCQWSAGALLLVPKDKIILNLVKR